jgi:hypothetical protein
MLVPLTSDILYSQFENDDNIIYIYMYIYIYIKVYHCVSCISCLKKVLFPSMQ